MKPALVQPVLKMPRGMWYLSMIKKARLIVSQTVLDTFQSLNMHYPKTDDKRKQELLSNRQQLTKESSEA